MTDTTNLPATTGDGFDNFGHNDDRIIQGTILKCTDAVWQDRNGLPAASNKLLAIDTSAVVQHWQNQQPIDTIRQLPGQDLPNVDDLNAKIPQREWEVGIDNKPRPPWQYQVVVYLIDPATAERFTFISGTIGAKIAVSNLKEQVQSMRMLRGDKVVPVVELSSKPMKTKFGTKLRPDFKIVGWVNLGTGELAAQAPLAISDLKTVTPPPTQEAMDDSIPF